MKKKLFFLLILCPVLFSISCGHKMTREEEITEANKKAEELYRLGQSYRSEKRYWKARRKFNKIVTNYPQSDYGDKAAFEIADIFREAESYWRAYEKYQNLVDDFPGSDLIPKAADEQINIGNYYWNKGKEYEAVEIYKKALDNYSLGEKAPDIQYRVAGYYFEYAENYHGLFSSVYKEENFDQAILEYKKALNNYPNHPLSTLAKYRLGMAYYYTSLPWYNDQATTDDALSSFQELSGEKGAEEFQNDIDSKMSALLDKKAKSEYQIGKFYLKQDLLKSARIYFQNVLDENYSKVWNAYAYFGLGETCWEEEKLDDARMYYNKAISEYPEIEEKNTINKRLKSITKKETRGAK